MSGLRSSSGRLQVGAAAIYYEVAGQGPPFVMIHAGVADSRQWNKEFSWFSKSYRVLRYDLRGFGRSEPVEGEFRHLDDLLALLDHVEMHEALVLMGCSMGGGLAMDFALEYPGRVKALILTGSAPSGLKLDVPPPPKYDQAMKADEAGDWDLLCELEVQIWFDGSDRTPDQVDPVARRLAYDMNRIALSHEARGLGKRLPDASLPAAERLEKLKAPLLVIVGVHDIPYMLAAADWMLEKLPGARKALVQDAAHLANMDHPEIFRQIVESFLKDL